MPEEDNGIPFSDLQCISNLWLWSMQRWSLHCDHCCGGGDSIVVVVVTMILVVGLVVVIVVVVVVVVVMINIVIVIVMVMEPSLLQIVFIKCTK